MIYKPNPLSITKLNKKIIESNVFYHGFIREMIETTDDNEIQSILSQKDDSELEYLAINVFDTKEQIDTLTKKFSLFKG